MAKKVHIGRNIACIRELRNMKQHALAVLMDMTQQKISIIEKSEEINPKLLREIATALGVTPSVIYAFNEQSILCAKDQQGELDFLIEKTTEADLFHDILSALSAYKGRYEKMIFERDQRIRVLEKELEVLRIESAAHANRVK